MGRAVTGRLRSPLDCSVEESSEEVALEMIGELTRYTIMATEADRVATAGEILASGGRPPMSIGIILSKLEQHRPDVRISMCLLGCLDSLGDRAGAWVLWALALVRATDANGGEPLSPAKFFSCYFQHGLPTEGAMRTLWAEQKVPGTGRNQLDGSAPWQTDPLVLH